MGKIWLRKFYNICLRRFSNIEEETPSYHRTYDFFIDRFAQVETTEYGLNKLLMLFLGNGLYNIMES